MKTYISLIIVLGFGLVPNAKSQPEESKACRLAQVLKNSFSYQALKSLAEIPSTPCDPLSLRIELHTTSRGSQIAHMCKAEDPNEHGAWHDQILESQWLDRAGLQKKNFDVFCGRDDCFIFDRTKTSNPDKLVSTPDEHKEMVVVSDLEMKDAIEAASALLPPLQQTVLNDGKSKNMRLANAIKNASSEDSVNAIINNTEDSTLCSIQLISFLTNASGIEIARYCKKKNSVESGDPHWSEAPIASQWINRAALQKNNFDIVCVNGDCSLYDETLVSNPDRCEALSADYVNRVIVDQTDIEKALYMTKALFFAERGMRDLLSTR